MNINTQSGDDSEKKITGVDLLMILLKWKNFIIYFVLITTILAAITSFILPKWYKSYSTLIPPKSQGLLGGLGSISSLIKEIAPGAAGKLSSQANSYNFLAILNSRKASEMMINKFNLFEVYNIKDNSIEKTIEEFQKNLNIEVTEHGSVVIDIYDRDPNRAAEMVNYMCIILNEISIEIGKNEARSNREFLEKRVGENRIQLSHAEEKLKEFQQENGLINITDDAKSTATSVSGLFASKVKAEIELAILEKTVGINNLTYRQLELEKKELENKLTTLPQLGMESFRLYRDVLVQQKIMEILIPFYEQAKIEEHKDVPVMLVLDKAVPAEKKSYPKRMLIVVSTFLSSLFISIFIVLLIARFRIFKSKKQQEYIKLISTLDKGK